MGSTGTSKITVKQERSRLYQNDVTQQLREAQAGTLGTTYQDIQDMDNVKYGINTANLSDADKDVLKEALSQESYALDSKNNYSELWKAINTNKTIQISLNHMTSENLVALVKMLSKSKLTVSTTSLIEDALKRISYINQP